MFASVDSFGDLKPIVTPSGQSVSLTAEEEVAVVKETIQDRIKERMTYDISVWKALIQAAGSAMGLAVGALMVQWIFRNKR